MHYCSSVFHKALFSWETLEKPVLLTTFRPMLFSLYFVFLHFYLLFILPHFQISDIAACPQIYYICEHLLPLTQCCKCGERERKEEPDHLKQTNKQNFTKALAVLEKTGTHNSVEKKK